MYKTLNKCYDIKSTFSPYFVLNIRRVDYVPPKSPGCRPGIPDFFCYIFNVCHSSAGLLTCSFSGADERRLNVNSDSMIYTGTLPGRSLMEPLKNYCPRAIWSACGWDNGTYHTSSGRLSREYHGHSFLPSGCQILYQWHTARFLQHQRDTTGRQKSLPAVIFSVRLRRPMPAKNSASSWQPILIIIPVLSIRFSAVTKQISGSLFWINTDLQLILPFSSFFYRSGNDPFQPGTRHDLSFQFWYGIPWLVYDNGRCLDDGRIQTAANISSKCLRSGFALLCHDSSVSDSDSALCRQHPEAASSQIVYHPRGSGAFWISLSVLFWQFFGIADYIETLPIGQIILCSILSLYLSICLFICTAAAANQTGFFFWDCWQPSYVSL